jgi:putative DNA primase/helicase
MNPFKGRVTTSTYSGGLADPEQAKRALALFSHGDHTTHLTAAPSWRQVLVQGSPEQLLEAADSLSDGHGIFIGVNPVSLPPGSVEKVKDCHIVQRSWLFIDADPVRPSPGSNSTEEEHEAARLMVLEVMDTLGREAGWPHPVIADSGNGWHLFYAIDLPNDDNSRRIVRDVLRALSSRFDTDAVKIDRSPHDARRVVKLPGCWTRKGPHSDERPHRPARLVSVPDSLEVVSVEQLESVAGAAPAKGRPPKTKPKGNPFTGRVNAGEDTQRQYAMAALEREAAACRTASTGTLNDQLFRSGAACGNFVPQHLSADVVFDALIGAIKQAGAKSPGKDEATLRRAIQRGMETPRNIPEQKSTTEKQTRANNNKDRNPKQELEEDGEPVTIQACDIEVRPVEWLWPGRIPVGKLTTVAGMPGLGKTFFLCDLVARVTACSPWPDGKANSDKGSVLFISGEDEPEDTLVPRLREAGADLTRVRFFRSKAFDRFSLKNLELLCKAVAEADDDCRLVCIDPPTSFVMGSDDHKNAELRGILTPLARWAAEHKCSVVFVTHLNKGGGTTKVEAATRVVGSIAWVAATRAAYLMSKDPEEPDRRIFATIKCNLAPEPPTLAYRLAHTEDGRGRLEWLGVVDVSADDAVNKVANAGAHKDACKFLIEMFRSKQEWESEELFRDAKEEHISRRSMFRAKDRLGMPKPKKIVKPDGSHVWVWWVPTEWEYLRDTETETKI